MTSTTLRVALAAAALAGLATRATAQGAVRVSGHVTAQGAPLDGAHVRIDELKIDRTTSSDGAYSFVVPSGFVRGQTVTIVVNANTRRGQYAPASEKIALVGGSIVKDFNLVPLGQNGAPMAIVPASQPNAVTTKIASSENAPPDESAGAVDVASAIAGRIPSLLVSTSSVPGGSALLQYRGPHSLLSSGQPLFVVDGVVADNTVFTSSAQRFGAGGFDYGSPIGDLDLANVASVQFLGGAAAAAQFGGRAANGVVAITTRRGTITAPFSVFASVQQTGESVVRLPTFQNQYGQGLNGQFQFFNGRGGGINDATDQSWGPPLDGRAVAQASYVAAGRADVRLWTPRPNNVENFFQSGATTNVTAGVEGGSRLLSFRGLVGSRTTTGIVPSDRLSRLTGDGLLTFSPTPRFVVDGHLFGTQTKNDDASGTGFNVGNPVSQFVRMGRQVDTDSLKKHLRDATGNAISWNYAGQNNPFFAPLLDSNYSHRYHVGGGGSARYALTPWLDATARGGVDYVHDGRLFAIGTGWQGGFPFYAGAGNFSKGGSEGDLIFSQENTASLRFDARRTIDPGSVMTVSVGTDFANSTQRVQSLGVDSIVNVPSAGAPVTATLPPVQSWSGRSTSNSLFAETGMSFKNGASFAVTLRDEWTSMFAGQSSSSLYPTLRGALDLLRAFADSGSPHLATSAVVHAGWWRSSANLTAYDIGTMYSGRPTTGSVAPAGVSLLGADSSLSPQITTSYELGADLAFRPAHATVGLAYYHESTTGLIVPVLNALAVPIARNAAAMSNSGVEGRAGVSFGDGAHGGIQWDLSATAATNSNTVDRLYGNVNTLPLGPQQVGLTVAARPGQPLGVLLGRKLLRDPSTGALLLRNGLPLPDSVAGDQILGSAQPKWSLGAQSAIRYRWFTVAGNADGRFGGQVFSATNRWGSYSGTLSNTAFRPDSGLLLTGIDATTHQPNTQHVTTEAYFHALGAVQEPWVYSASYFKLRELRVSADFGLPVPYSLFETVRTSLVARNVFMWASAPNIDPEGVFSPYQLMGVEMGQLPQTRTIGIQISLVP
jgi:TonB-dependent SusC/RagA subfamily outer membrane receptor